MADQGVLFTEDAADRILDAVDRVEGLPVTRKATRRRGATADVPPVLTVRVTSGTANANGYYPGVVTAYSAPSAAWTDYGACSVKSPSSAVLLSGSRYAARPAGLDPTDNATPAYLTVEGGGAVSAISAVNPGTGDPAAFDVAGVTRIKFDELSGIVTTNNGDGSTTESLQACSATHLGVISAGDQVLCTGTKHVYGGNLLVSSGTLTDVFNGGAGGNGGQVCCLAVYPGVGSGAVSPNDLGTGLYANPLNCFEGSTGGGYADKNALTCAAYSNALSKYVKQQFVCAGVSTGVYTAAAVNYQTALMLSGNTSDGSGNVSLYHWTGGTLDGSTAFSVDTNGNLMASGGVTAPNIGPDVAANVIASQIFGGW